MRLHKRGEGGSNILFSNVVFLNEGLFSDLFNVSFANITNLISAVTCLPRTTTAYPPKVPSLRPVNPTTSWYSSRQPPTPTKPWKPITGKLKLEAIFFQLHSWIVRSALDASSINLRTWIVQVMQLAWRSRRAGCITAQI